MTAQACGLLGLPHVRNQESEAENAPRPGGNNMAVSVHSTPSKWLFPRTTIWLFLYISGPSCGCPKSPTV